MGFFSSLVKGAVSTLKDVAGGVVSSVVPGPFGDMIGGVISGAGREASNGVNVEKQYQLAEEAREDEQQFNAEQAQLNRDFQKQERLDTQQFNIDMWNMNNEYNSPVEQLKRMTAAGINPNTAIASMYGGGSNAVTSSPMSGNAASYSSSLASSMLTGDATIRSLLANVDKTNAEAKNVELDNQYQQASMEDRLKYMNEQFNNLSASTQNILSEKQTREDTYRMLLAKTEDERKVLQENARKLAEEISNIKKQGEGIDIENAIKKVEQKFVESSGLPANTSVQQSILHLAKSGTLPEVLTQVVESIAKAQHPLFNMDNAKSVGKYVYERGKSILEPIFGHSEPTQNHRNP